MPGYSDVLNTREAAAFLGAHTQTIRKLARSGRLPSFKVGKDWRFRKEALLSWADEQRPTGDKCSVLIIDDEANFCLVMSKIIERLGYHTRHTTSAAMGLELVAEEAPDMILLDLKMPVMNGPQFLKKLRKTHPDLPVVIVTAYPDSDLMLQATKYAPLMLLAKPVDAQLLERTVRTLGNKTEIKRAG